MNAGYMCSSWVPKERERIRVNTGDSRSCYHITGNSDLRESLPNAGKDLGV